MGKRMLAFLPSLDAVVFQHLWASLGSLPHPPFQQFMKVGGQCLTVPILVLVTCDELIQPPPLSLESGVADCHSLASLIRPFSEAL